MISSTVRINTIKKKSVGAFGEGSDDLHSLIHHLAESRVREAGPQSSAGEEGSTEDGGSRDCFDHFIPAEVFVGLWSTRSGSSPPAGKVGRDWPRSSSSCWKEELCSPAGEEVGAAKKGRCPECPAGEEYFEERAFQAYISCT